MAGMEPLRVLTATEQVAAWLRQALRRGEWGGRMPGGDRLAAELGVGRNTMEAALQLLEGEGVLVPQGAGRRRRIAVPDDRPVHPLRVAILDYGPLELISGGYMFELQRQLEVAGHRPFFAAKSLQELGMEVRRVARLVAKTEADAWIVCAGSREVLEWFAAQPVPTFALFGRHIGLPLAGVCPDMVPPLRAATRALIAHGHRRIVLLERRDMPAMEVGRFERGFLDELAAHGIVPSPYNLPDWDDSREGFHRHLDELYRLTAPTALILDQATLFVPALQHLAQRGLLAPQHVSLVCTDREPAFDWCQPTIAHIRYDLRPALRRVVRWTANVSHGKDDRRQSFTKAEFVEGGTIGPVRD
ncbi:MAG: substrate-binding domain-containing protein [Verrucomicrobia bacterium]|nr:substrate-binding domain-containing protein [Verrucomicrobiota bacterium]